LINIGDKVKVIVGSNTGSEGIYDGIHPNSNWHKVKFAGGDFLFVNLEEIELMETPNEVKVPVTEIKTLDDTFKTKKSKK
jgi:hypothetical protein